MARSKRCGNRSSRINRKRRARHGRTNEYDALELRQMLAFSSVFAGGTLTLTQTVDDGGIVIDNNGTGDAFRTIDGSGTSEFVAATHVEIALLDSTGNQLDIDLDNAHTGNVNISAGDGARSINFIGATNAIDGDLIVTAGTGAQTVNVSSTTAFAALGSGNVGLGTGSDVLNMSSGNFSVGTNLDLTGVNQFVFGNVLTVGGSMSMDTSGESEDSTIQEVGAGSSTIANDFTYTGGSDVDDVFLNDVAIGGNALIGLGDGITGGGDDQDVELFSGGSVGGTTTITSGDSTNGDTISFFAGSTFGGDIDLNLGEGVNTVSLLSTFNGNTVTYTGGSAVDTINYGFTGNLADVNATLGAGNDSFVLNAGASIAPTTLAVDFGDDAGDLFTNGYGQFDFNAQLTNLNGFDHEYNSVTDTLTSTQVSDPGAVTVDNNGSAGAVRFTAGATHSLTTTSNLVVNMLDGSGTQLDVDLDSAFVGDLSVNLGDGARNLNFIGSVNTIDGFLSVTGGDGNQVVEVVVGNTLTVTESASFDLGLGSDTVDENGNDITITGNLSMSGVNTFENNGVMQVGGNVDVDATIDALGMLYDDDATMLIGGNFTFTGGDGRDEVTLNGTTSTIISGNASIDIGDNTAGGTQFVFLNSSSSQVGGDVTIRSTSATHSDNILFDAAATLGGNVDIDLGDGPNTSTIAGVLGGNSVEYRGGSGVDTVSFGTSGNAANVNIRLGAGNDGFTFQAGSTAPSLLRVDFGGGNDTFNNNYGNFTFVTALLNWHDFNRYFSPTLSQWNIVQNADVGDIDLNYDAAGNVVLNNVFTSTMPPADNVRLTTLSNTGNVAIGIESAMPGFMFVTVGQGDRSITLDGANNTINGFLRIEASSGVQSVELAATSDLTVAGATVINLRDGDDSVTHVANVDLGSLFLRGVNDYENASTLLVNGNLVINTTFEVEDSRFDNDGTMTVVGKMIYMGGDGQDDVILNSGVSVGEAYLDVGTGDGFPSQTIDLTDNFLSNGRVYLFAGDAFGGNQLIMDSTSTVAGDLVVDFSASSTDNQVVIDGVFAGGYGIFKGGTGQDTVSMDAIAEDMDFVLRLGDDQDTFDLLAGTDVFFMYADFGEGVDTFNDAFNSVYPFAVVTKRLP